MNRYEKKTERGNPNTLVNGVGRVDSGVVDPPGRKGMVADGIGAVHAAPALDVVARPEDVDGVTDDVRDVGIANLDVEGVVHAGPDAEGAAARGLERQEVVGVVVLEAVGVVVEVGTLQAGGESLAVGDRRGRGVAAVPEPCAGSALVLVRGGDDGIKNRADTAVDRGSWLLVSSRQCCCQSKAGGSKGRYQ